MQGAGRAVMIDDAGSFHILNASNFKAPTNLNFDIHQQLARSKAIHMAPLASYIFLLLVLQLYGSVDPIRDALIGYL